VPLPEKSITLTPLLLNVFDECCDTMQQVEHIIGVDTSLKETDIMILWKIEGRK
jgi:hypothetical protein